MKAWVQRVTEASVTIECEKAAEIGLGYLILLGIGVGDTEKAADEIARGAKFTADIQNMKLSYERTF